MELDEETEARVVEKVEYIEEAVTVLSRKQSLKKAAYLGDREQRAIVEREFQTALEACIDIAEKFARLGRRSVLSEDTAAAMQEDLHWFPTFLREVREVLDRDVTED